MEKNLVNDLSITRHHLVRLATHADLPDIAHIARATWDVTYKNIIAPENRHEFLARVYKPENLADAVDTPGHWFYVVEWDHTVVGFGHFLQRYHPSCPRAELVRLYILPDYQKLGLGATILKTGFKALARAGIEQCFVSVQSSNMSAQKFYKRYGFTFHRSHGQFLGTQIVTLVEYVRPIDEKDLAE
jgi:ribosomal protein S18 acetylase RimI-like enzyme